MKKRLVINGKEYPVRMTMGALLRFKQETGRDVSEIRKDDVADLIVLLWCAVKSACAAEKVPFEYGLEEFADALSPEDLNVLDENLGTGEEKKTAE